MSHDNRQHIIDVFTRLRHRLLGVSRSVVNDDNAADDVLQDAFVRLWSRPPELADEGQAVRYAATVVRNLSVDHVRRRQAACEVGIDRVADMAADDADERRQQVYETVVAIVDRELTPTQRAIIDLREHQAMDYDEIARRLGMQPAAVRQQLSRARKRVREIYRQRAKGGEQ